MVRCPRIAIPFVLKKIRPVAIAPRKQLIQFAGAALGMAILALGVSSLQPRSVTASDHDDGDIDVRSRALSLTDLYAFREVDQNPAANPNDLILVMNTNPRSLARQEYYFSTQARYEFRVSRVGNKNASPTAVPDLTLRFTFSNPTGRFQQQRMTVSLVDRSGRTTTATQTINRRPILTTSLQQGTTPIENQINLGGSRISVFAGLREDPFFFDVEQFFRVRAGLLGQGPSVGFRPPEQAIDFTTGYNVNTIVVRVPRRLLQGNTRATTYDVWLSLLIPDPRTRQFVQTEQLARPGINELLVLTQPSLAAYNTVQPTTRVTPALGVVAGEAKTTLRALGNSNARADALLKAFLPDVMRIDTTGPSGFANALNTLGAPIRGRLLSDDVIDIALTVLTNGAVTTDNVTYSGVPGNPGQGHDPLSPSFPYLALPN